MSVLVDANVLLFAVDVTSPFNGRAASWLTAQLNGSSRVGIAWSTLVAFLRISTSPRVYERPLRVEEAWARIGDWQESSLVWIVEPTDVHGDVLEGLMRRHQVSGDLVADAHLAALAIEHGLTVASADTDFARFTEIRWVNPIAP